MGGIVKLSNENVRGEFPIILFVFQFSILSTKIFIFSQSELSKVSKLKLRDMFWLAYSHLFNIMQLTNQSQLVLYFVTCACYNPPTRAASAG